MAETTSNPLWRALESSAADLERMIARTDQVLAASLFLLSLFASAVIAPGLGLALAALAVPYFLYFSVSASVLSRGYGFAVLRWTNPLVEITVPATALIGIALSQGPAYSLGSWVPPMLFTLFIGAAILRLHPWIPALAGLVAGLEYALIWAVGIRPYVDSAVVLHSPRVQAVRVLSLVLYGVTASIAVGVIRRLIASANADVRSQELFGKYRMLGEIASGGMGKVVRAVYCPEGGFERPVAIKLIHPHLAANEGFVQRFRTEAELAARLAHPNIVGALDFGRIDDTFFLALEFVDGPTLGDLMRHRRDNELPLSLHLVCHIGRQIAAGLNYAHEVALASDGSALRVVHRDLSPSNVLLGRNGSVQITDFGVARALGTEHSAQTQTIAGKPSYIAPEQLKDGTIDQRVDLWAAGVILWELVANQRLFHRNEEAATLYAVIEAEIPSVCPLRPEASEAWDAFFRQALARDPAARFASARDLGMALALLADGEGRASAQDLAEVLRAIKPIEELELDPTRVG